MTDLLPDPPTSPSSGLPLGNPPILAIGVGCQDLPVSTSNKVVMSPTHILNCPELSNPGILQNVE